MGKSEIWAMKEEISFSLRESKLERGEEHKENSGTYCSTHFVGNGDRVILLKYMPEI